jgi:hypothetical protein
VFLIERLHYGEYNMGEYNGLTPEEQARITEIQDSLIERYVELKQALRNGDKIRVRDIEFEIKELHHEKEEIERWATA